MLAHTYSSNSPITAGVSQPSNNQQSRGNARQSTADFATMSSLSGNNDTEQMLSNLMSLILQLVEQSQSGANGNAAQNGNMQDADAGNNPKSDGTQTFGGVVNSSNTVSGSNNTMGNTASSNTFNAFTAASDGTSASGTPANALLPASNGTTVLGNTAQSTGNESDTTDSIIETMTMGMSDPANTVQTMNVATSGTPFNSLNTGVGDGTSNMISTVSDGMGGFSNVIATINAGISGESFDSVSTGIGDGTGNVINTVGVNKPENVINTVGTSASGNGGGLNTGDVINTVGITSPANVINTLSA